MCDPDSKTMCDLDSKTMCDLDSKLPFVGSLFQLHERVKSMS